MASFPQNIRLIGGEEVILRPVEQRDEQALIAFFSKVPEDDRLFLKDDVTDPQVVKNWLQHIDLEHIFPLLALQGDIVLGDATLHRNSFGWSTHVGEIRVVVAREWQRKGVAQALVRALVSRAIDAGLEILEANVLEGQHGALRAFERIGFKVETVLKNRAKDRTGRNRDVMVMTNDVSELWRRMEDMISDLEYNPRGY